MFAIYTFCCLLMVLKTLTLLHRIAYTQSDILISNSGLLKLILLLNVFFFTEETHSAAGDVSVWRGEF